MRLVALAWRYLWARPLVAALNLALLTVPDKQMQIGPIKRIEVRRLARSFANSTERSLPQTSDFR